MTTPHGPPVEQDGDADRHRPMRLENVFARIKDRRRIATRYDRCGDLFLTAICIAATVMFSL